MRKKIAYYEKLRIIDRVLGKTTIDKRVLELLDNKQVENYFFRNVKSVHWYELLKANDYFSQMKAPGPSQADKEGYISIPQWNVLPYLEWLSGQTKENQNEKYVAELISIIQKTTDFHVKHAKCIDNYNTWCSFVKILVNISRDRIPPRMIKNISVWLDTKYDTTLLGSEIALNLLPKFLSSESTEEDSRKAEYIFNCLTGIKWITQKRKGYFETGRKPKIVVDFHWLEESLWKQKNIARIAEKCSASIIYNIADKLKEIFRKQRSDIWIDADSEEIIYRLTIRYKKNFKFMCTIGTIEREKVADSQKGKELVKLLSARPSELWRFYIDDCKTREHFVVELISKISILKLPEEVIGYFKDGADFLYDTIFKDNSYIWYSSLDSRPGSLSRDAKEFLTSILRDMLCEKTNYDQAAVKEILQAFLGSTYEYAIFKRLVLFVVNRFWEQYHNIFEDILKTSLGKRIFSDQHYEAELYSLLENRISYVNDPTKAVLKEMIEMGPQNQLPEEIRDQYVNQWKQKWYSALKTDDYFKGYYEKYTSELGTQEIVALKKPIVQTRSGPGRSPFTTEEIVDMDNEKLVEFMFDFSTKDIWEDPTVDGFAEVLKNTAKAYPQKFTDNLTPFINAPYLYTNHILWGIRDAWNKESRIDWDNLLRFVTQIIGTSGFWENKLKIAGDHWKPDYKPVITTIASLIQDGSKEKEGAFTEDNIGCARDIVYSILDKHKDDLRLKSKEKTIDYVGDAHNSPLGNVLIALIYLSWRIAKFEEKRGIKRTTKLCPEFEEKYDNILNSNIEEAYTILGAYLPQLSRLYPRWVQERTEKLLSRTDEKAWQAFMTGYLHDNRVYDDIYNMDSIKKHYYKALKASFEKEFAKERLVQHITIAYLRDNEDLSLKSLFREMLESWQLQQINEVIDFFWTQRQYLTTQTEYVDIYRSKVIKFWAFLVSKYEMEPLKQDDKLILSKVTKLISFIPKLDKKYLNWLMFSVPYIHLGSNERWIFEYLDLLKDKRITADAKIKSARHVLKLILKLLEYHVPGYGLDYIKSILLYYYDLNNKSLKKMCNIICNLYGEAGIDFLRDLWEKYNPIEPN